MAPFSVDAAGVHIFALTLHWYGILLVFGAWSAAELASWLAARDGFDTEHVWRGLVWVVLFGLVGARLWFVIFPPDSMVAVGRTADWLLSHPFDLNQGALAIWTGGMGLLGGIAGGVLGLWLYTRRHGLPLPLCLDIAAVALPLAQAIARWGSAANQDLYGPVTTLPWGVLVDNPEQRIGPYTDLTRYPLASTLFHPVYAYEAIWAALVCAVLLAAFLRYRKRLRPGSLALLFAVLYGGGRLLLEFLRTNVSHIGPVNISQVVAGVSATVALIILIRINRTKVLHPPDTLSREFHNKLDQSSLQS